MKIRFPLLAGSLIAAAFPTTVWAAEESDSSPPPATATEDPEEALELPEPAFGASIALKSTHVDLANAFRYTADPVQPVVEAEATYRFAEGCQVRAWGVRAVNHDAAKGDIWEVDAGANCDIAVGNDTTLNLGVEQWMVPGPDITAAMASVTRGAIDATVTYMATAGKDGQRAEVGISPTIDPKFDLRLAAGIERGFDAPTIGVANVTAEYRLNDERWSVFAGAAYGFAEHGDPRRGGKVEVGIRFSF